MSDSTPQTVLRFISAISIVGGGIFIIAGVNGRAVDVGFRQSEHIPRWWSIWLGSGLISFGLFVLVALLAAQVVGNEVARVTDIAVKHLHAVAGASDASQNPPTRNRPQPPTRRS